jgi:uncharacterized membrane protein YphA (DoxX/SURF4 family)
MWAGLAKIGRLQESVLAVSGYDVLPLGLVRPVAAALPWVEVLLGAFLLTGAFVRFAGAATAALILMFIAGLTQAWIRGLPIDCGCFGGGGPGEGVTVWDILRDIPLLAAALYLAWRPRGPFRLDHLIQKEESRS